MENIPVEKSSSSAGRVMVVDDEVGIMSSICELLSDEGYETTGFCAGSEAIELLKKQEFDLLITDLMMPGMDGIDVLRKGIEIDPNLVCIIMTGYGTVQTAVEAMKTGAFDYILKPFKPSGLLPILTRAMQVRSLQDENMQLRETIAIHELGKAIAFSSDLNSIMNMVADAALLQCKADEVSIMLPTADGKELYVAVVRGSGCAEKVGIHIPLEQGIAGWVARNKEPMVLRGEVNDPGMAPVKPRSDIHTAVSMPMMSSGKLVGVLNVNITQNHRQFKMGQLKVLGILVSIISPILEKMQLYLQIREGE
ncbi:MAG: response regulator, partial [Desulfobacterium sp.]|nr:response regulator [Desulfobacterium sp.]MBU4035155.1 response regulator [Pseudomonadota bacterium]